MGISHVAVESVAFAGRLGGFLSRVNSPGQLIWRDCRRDSEGGNAAIRSVGSFVKWSAAIGFESAGTAGLPGSGRRSMKPLRSNQKMSASNQRSSRANPNGDSELISKSIHHDAAAIRNAHQVLK